MVTETGLGMGWKSWRGKVLRPMSRETHATIIGTVLGVHLVAHYAIYLPLIGESWVQSMMYQVHTMLETYFLIPVIYASLFRLKGGAMALGITALTLLPLIPTAGLHVYSIWPGDAKDMAVQVGMILMVGSMMVMVQEFVARENEKRFRLRAALDLANTLLIERDDDLDQVSQDLKSNHRQLVALNKMIQSELNTLFTDVHGAT